MQRLFLKLLSISLLVIASFCIIFVFGMRVLQAMDAIAHEHSEVLALQALLQTTADAETGQRGYLLTGDMAYLEPYTNAKTALAVARERIRDFVEDGSISRDEIGALNLLIDQKMAELQQTVTLRTSNHPEEALAIVRGDSGKITMDRVRESINKLSRRANDQLAAANGRVHQLTQVRNAVYAGVAIVNLGFIAWSYLRLRREHLERERATAELARQKELLAVTLASIGDAVIVTDDQGKITFVNETASKLSGWQPSEAVGRLCAEVFNIINETSRQRVESPVEKVFRLGTIVGLANHTLLIRRDGSELPIDDSGAPIRNQDGQIRGVVLVFRDFSEHKIAERNLQAVNATLEAANKAKDQFLATLSHELRTPLTPVLATLSVWEGSSTLPANMLSSVRMLRRNVELEARLIDDLLDLTRIAKGKMPINLELVDVHNLLQNAVDMYASDIRSKRIKTSLNLNATDFHVSADPARLSQVFWNILKNATKFTPEGGSIDVITENRRGGQLVIRISDSGIGMTPELMGRLFQPFEQGEAPIVRRLGGLGLGMALAKALLDAQHGEIVAASDGPGKGSNFTVSMRYVATVASPQTNLTPPSRFDLSTARADEQSRMSILLVEDHADTAEVLQQVLMGLGHEATVAHTVNDGLKAFDAGRFDLVISDIGLPDGTGLDLIRGLRQKYLGPAVALTGFGMEEDITRCLEAGFDAHLVKPVDMRKLALTLQQVRKSNRGANANGN